MSYNLTQLGEADNIYKLVVYANDSSGQTLSGMLMFAIFFVFLLLFKRYGMDNAILGASFICFVLSIYLSFAKLLSFYVVLAFLTITAFGVLYKYTKRD